MSSEANNTDIFDFFFVEADDHLQVINDGLLSLERNKDDPVLVDKIFRAVHGIKGSAGMIGFPVISQLAHKIEDLLAKIREGELDASESIVDLLFQSVDTLAGQIEDASNGQKEDSSLLPAFDTLYSETLGPSGFRDIPEIFQEEVSEFVSEPSPFEAEQRPDTTLAEFYIEQDLFDKAIDVYRQILHADPSNKTVRQRLEKTVALQVYIEET